MKTSHKLFIGGLGGCIPVLLNFVMIESKAMAEIDIGVSLGIMGRAVFLFFIGALWVYLQHENEENKMSIFQLGALAPVAILAIMNGNNLIDLKNQSDKVSSPAIKEHAPKTKKMSFLPFAYAEPILLTTISDKPAQNFKGKDGAPMVLVPAGDFTMGANESFLSRFERGLLGKITPADEAPAHKVYLDVFYIDKYEVTTSRYGNFFQSTGREKPENWTNTVLVSQGDRPVVGVTWGDAMAYCEHYGKRLPTEAEWEKAARGTDGPLYPWGNDTPTERHANFNKSRFQNYGVLAKVGSLKAGGSPYGVYDMAGNVWEWVADWYDENYYKNSPRKNPKGPSNGKNRVIRGGSWFSGVGNMRAANRASRVPSYRTSVVIGFRCAQDAPK